MSEVDFWEAAAARSADFAGLVAIRRGSCRLLSSTPGGVGGRRATTASASPPCTHLQLSQPATGLEILQRGTPSGATDTSSTTIMSWGANCRTLAEAISTPARMSAPGALIVPSRQSFRCC